MKPLFGVEPEGNNCGQLSSAQLYIVKLLVSCYLSQPSNNSKNSFPQLGNNFDINVETNMACDLPVLKELKAVLHKRPVNIDHMCTIQISLLCHTGAAVKCINNIKL